MYVCTDSFVDCSTSMRIAGSKKPVNCHTATYINDRLDDFVDNCAPKDWKEFFGRESVKVAIKSLADELEIKAKTSVIQPPMPFVFKALEKVAPWDIKVVILGQDPTPQEGKPTGLAFSVDNPLAVGSALNVLMEVALEGWSVDIADGDLSWWAEQGVLLLNSALTTGLEGFKNVLHLDYWCPFTKLLIEYISIRSFKSVWLLWGKMAQEITFRIDLKTQKCFDENRLKTLQMIDFPKFESLIDKSKDYVITGGHPSPVAGVGRTNAFIGGNYFNCANFFLKEKGRGIIDWGLVKGVEKLPGVNRGLKVCPPFTHIFFRRGRPVHSPEV